jgi:hypothetical protein
MSSGSLDPPVVNMVPPVSFVKKVSALAREYSRVRSPALVFVLGRLSGAGRRLGLALNERWARKADGRLPAPRTTGAINRIIRPVTPASYDHLVRPYRCCHPPYSELVTNPRHHIRVLLAQRTVDLRWICLKQRLQGIK